MTHPDDEYDEDFCPACGANIGPVILEVEGCPLCGYTIDDEDDADDSDEDWDW